MKLFYKTAFLIATLGISSLVQAETFIVTEPDDMLSDGQCDASCTLRDAVDKANQSGDSDNLIQFASPGTYFVNKPGAGEDGNETGDIDFISDLDVFLMKNYTISGLGAEPVIIDGSNSGDRVFQTILVSTEIDGGFSRLISVFFENVTVMGGNAGGENGGGILFEGNSYFDITSTLGISQSHFTSNQASSGGGIFAKGQAQPGKITTQINNSTFSDNSAVSEGGGIYLRNSHAGINNSTFFENFSQNLGGAIFATNDENSIALKLNSSTIYGNTASQGGGMVIQRDIDDIETQFSNTILMGNSSNAQGTNCLAIGENTPSFQSDDYNIFGEINNTECDIILQSHDISTEDQNNTILENSLNGNGGPTPTLALLPGSIAINNANPEGCNDSNNIALSSDQRVTVDRVIGSACDIGAFEANWANIVSNKTANVSDIKVGDTFSYAITVTNEGPNNATNLKVVDNLPTEVEFISVNPDDVCSHLNGVVTCDIPSLNNEESISIDIEVLAIKKSQNVINTVQANAKEEDPRLEDNSSSFSVDIYLTDKNVLQGSGELFNGCSLNIHSNLNSSPIVLILTLLISKALLMRRKH